MHNRFSKGCRYCQSTGDWRGKAGEKYPDFKSWENRCFHCNGTGQQSELFTNTCKYCGQPCNGFCCELCYNEFEESSFSYEKEEVFDVYAEA